MRRFLPPLFAGLIAWCIVGTFLSHWSLLDGAPRNSLARYLDGEAERPFAYRLLMPALVRSAGPLLPTALQTTLADRLAPPLHARFVAPLLALREPDLPGLTSRADSDWQRADYRRDYVLMVGLIWLFCTGALLTCHTLARDQGCRHGQSLALMVAYALLYPCGFLNGGYFYDFGEQFLASQLLLLALRRRWLAFALLLPVMQANKETALVLPVLLLPLLWPYYRDRRLRLLAGVGVAVLACIVLYVTIRQHMASLPGQASEWNLLDNLQFWGIAANWVATADLWAIGLPLPRLLYPVTVLAALAYSWRRGATPPALAATAAVLLWGGLMLVLGYRDEFRAIGMILPFLLLGVAACLGRVNTTSLKPAA